MNWEFFEEWADIKFEDRLSILEASGNCSSGEFVGLIKSIPSRQKLEALRKELATHKARNDKHSQ